MTIFMIKNYYSLKIKIIIFEYNYSLKNINLKSS